MARLANKLDFDKYLLIFGIGGVFLVGFIAVAYFSAGNADYLRASVPVTAPREQDIAPTAWDTFRQPGVPYLFEYPIAWTLQSEPLDSTQQEVVSVGTVKMLFYRTADIDVEAVVERELGESLHNLMSWDGKLGNTEGTYWARASIVKGTRAAYGQRVYVTTHNQNAAVLILPAPPYTEIEQRIFDSFSVR